MIDELRTFIKDTMKLVDPTLKWDGLVFDQDINSTNSINKEYKIIFGEVKPQRLDTDYRANIPCVVKMYRGTGNASIEKDYDYMFCQGIEFSALAMKQERLDQEGHLKNVSATSSFPIPVEDNDNMIQVSIELDLEVYFDVK